MLLVSKYTAIRQLIHEHLLAALSIYTKGKDLLFRQWEDIPLFKSRENCEVLYISGVAFKLSKLLRCDVSAICDQIVSHFSQNGDENYRVKVVSPGWIQISVVDAIACLCLQSIIDAGAEQNHQVNLSSDFSPKLFTAQYAHARCCSLLRLAVREGVEQWQVIPWLDGNRIRLTHPACRNLIGKLIEVVDQLVTGERGEKEQGAGSRGEKSSSGGLLESKYYEKSCLTLSKAFEDFWSQCPIWSDKSPEVLQTKLGLVLATQLIMKYLLENKLNIYAPLEL